MGTITMIQAMVPMAASLYLSCSEQYILFLESLKPVQFHIHLCAHQKAPPFCTSLTYCEKPSHGRRQQLGNLVPRFWAGQALPPAAKSAEFFI